MKLLSPKLLKYCNMKNGELNGIIITVKKAGVSALPHKQIKTAASKRG